MSDCVFCRILNDSNEPAEIVWSTVNSIGIVPLNPVTEGHVIIVPNVHVSDALEEPDVTGTTMHDAAWYAKSEGIGPVNFITSVGREATQSVFHLHIHVVPRAENDGLALPWYSGKTSKKREVH